MLLPQKLQKVSRRSTRSARPITTNCAAQSRTRAPIRRRSPKASTRRSTKPELRGLGQRPEVDPAAFANCRDDARQAVALVDDLDGNPRTHWIDSIRYG